jgi:hypothetical protein
LEEYDFLDEICWTALYTNKHVNFAAVVDSEGKLIVGKSRMSLIQKRPKIKSKTYAEMFCSYKEQNYGFYTDYLLPTIKKMVGSYYRYYGYTTTNERIHFEVVEVNRNADSVRIVITPLTQSKDKYLCVYFESRVTTSNKDILMEIDNII